MDWRGPFPTRPSSLRARPPARSRAARSFPGPEPLEPRQLLAGRAAVQWRGPRQAGAGGVCPTAAGAELAGTRATNPSREGCCLEEVFGTGGPGA